MRWLLVYVIVQRHLKLRSADIAVRVIGAAEKQGNAHEQHSSGSLHSNIYIHQTEQYSTAIPAIVISCGWYYLR
jgi:hypothetical protein